jgi:eukaryotic-like serine/threonine-protein kinase
MEQQRAAIEHAETLAWGATPAGPAGEPFAFAATMAAAPPSEAVTATGAVRSTVLPRMELVDAVPTLVVQGKRRFELVRQLGIGGLGEVIGAEDNDIGRKVALKKLRTDMKSAATLARFVEEIRTVGKLEHPNIIPIHDVGVDEAGDYYFVMKYVDGETLESVIEKLAKGDPVYHRRFTTERRVQIFMGVLEAVAFAHSKGVIHRDIKPANIMVGPYGEVVLMDWGIAKTLREGGSDDSLLPKLEASGEGRKRLFETQIGSVIGTPAYMAPEQARGDKVDERTDIYALSVLFFELLTLDHYLGPYAETLEKMLEGVKTVDAPMALNVKSPHQPSVSPDLSWFLRKGLAKRAEERYQTVNEMVERLQRRADGDIPVQCHITAVRRATNVWTRFLDQHPIRASIALFGVPVLLIAAFVLVRFI